MGMQNSEFCTLQLPGASTTLYKSRSEAATALVGALRGLPTSVADALSDAGCAVDALARGVDLGLKSVEGTCRDVLLCIDSINTINSGEVGNTRKKNVSKDVHLAAVADELGSISRRAVVDTAEAEGRLLDFFLGPEELVDVLSIDVDPSHLKSRSHRRQRREEHRQAEPMERKRALPPDGGSRRMNAEYNQSKWTATMQAQLSLLVQCMLGKLSAENGASMTKTTRKLASKLQHSGACQGMQLMGASLNDMCETLDVGGFADPDEFLTVAEVSCKLAVDKYLLDDGAEMRKGKVMGYADSFVNVLIQSLVDLLGVVKPKKVRCQSTKLLELGFYADQSDPDKPAVKLPDSIASNREPFRHGPWRKTPFKPRPYVRLTEYHIVEEFAKSEIALKLQTQKRGSCAGSHCTDREGLGHYSLAKDGFVSECACLSRNVECDDGCGCNPSTCLNRAVSKRDAVRLGVDVEEIDSWGMDCYTRKNIYDAVLESQAFGSIASAEDPQAAVPAVDDPPHQARKRKTESACSLGLELLGDPLDEYEAKNLARQDAVLNARQGASDWIELVLVPAINKQGAQGWDLHCALDHVIDGASRAEQGDVDASRSMIAARAVKAKLDLVGPLYFRLHPKGVGLVCKREEGLPPLTFVEEYLGEIHLPWRWFELQDAVKKITGSELPDFYNIVLERPKDDPAGYDVLFVDAAAKGAVASRMSHSCTPNCQAVVMSCNGRLTIALYTLRHVHPGEELTFDYSSVTESEKEFKQAICLCGTEKCRGSYLYFTGSKTFMQILLREHNMLHRQVLLARAAEEPLGHADGARLAKFGLGSSCLGSREDGTRVPNWLEKWTSLICEYLEIEETSLKEELLALDRYDETLASAEARGVIMNRVQNIVITLDKIRMVLKQPDQTLEPPLRRLSDSEVALHLWNGPASISKRLLQGCVGAIVPENASIPPNPQGIVSFFLDHKGWPCTGPTVPTVPTVPALPSQSLGSCGASCSEEEVDEIVRLAQSVQEVATSATDARKKLMSLSEGIRKIDLLHGGGMTAAADLGVLYASTTKWVKSTQDYKTFVSPKVPINLGDLFLNREGDGGLEPIDEKRLVSAAQSKAKKHEKHPALRKSYRPTYIWGQLSSWFKQTVNDPTASLSADRRGCISLPDVDSAFKTGYQYVHKDRKQMLDQLETKPDTMWRTGTIWQFKNDSKCYGSPMLDQAWYQVTGEGIDPMPSTLKMLRNAKLPSSVPKAFGKPTSYQDPI
jgi:hypothetical protein